MKTYFIIALLLTGGIANAEGFIFKSGDYEKKIEYRFDCEGLAGKTGDCFDQFDEPYNQKISKSLERMNSTLQRDKDKFQIAQSKWLDFAKSQCDFEAAAGQTYAKKYFVSDGIYNDCMNKLKSLRAEYLDQIDTGCTGCVQ